MEFRDIVFLVDIFRGSHISLERNERWDSLDSKRLSNCSWIADYAV
jgi:hypothetical protein